MKIKIKYGAILEKKRIKQERKRRRDEVKKVSLALFIQPIKEIENFEFKSAFLHFYINFLLHQGGCRSRKRTMYNAMSIIKITMTENSKNRRIQIARSRKKKENKNDDEEIERIMK